MNEISSLSELKNQNLLELRNKIINEIKIYHKKTRFDFDSMTINDLLAWCHPLYRNDFHRKHLNLMGISESVE